MKASLKPRARVPRRLRPALRSGAKVEMEHTRSRRTAEVIASHHLAEFGARYYPALAKMERKLARGNPGLNAAFHRWFGKSVLTTKDGQPMPLYHGTVTDVNFDKFKVSDGNYGQGVYLAPAWHANKYAEGNGGRLIPVFARVERPLLINMPSKSTTPTKDKGYEIFNDLVMDPARRAAGKTVGQWLQTIGYDGVIVTVDGAIYMVNVLSPGQVKSVHNKGTWSRRSSVLLNPGPGRKARPDWLRHSVVKKVVFHATAAADFKAFDTSRSDLGAHFGTIEQAEYTVTVRKGGQAGVRIIPVWLNIQHPLRLKDEGSFHADAIAKQLMTKGIIDRATYRQILEDYDQNWQSRKKWDPAVRKAIEDAGYDGVVYKNTYEGKGDSYIAFRPEQIKSAIGNKGTFDTTDPIMTNPRRRRGA